MRKTTKPLTLALSLPNTIGRIVEVDSEGTIVRERKVLMCDGRAIAIKEGKRWNEI